MEGTVDGMIICEPLYLYIRHCRIEFYGAEEARAAHYTFIDLLSVFSTLAEREKLPALPDDIGCMRARK